MYVCPKPFSVKIGNIEHEITQTMFFDARNVNCGLVNQVHINDRNSGLKLLKLDISKGRP